jgi:hypothetical protein
MPAAAKPVSTSSARPQVAFPKKNQPPTAAAFAARLPLALGKRFEAVRAFLIKQTGVSEEPYFYGPRSGWALRYLREGRPVCSLHIHDDLPMGLVSLDPRSLAGIDWKSLSAAGQKARKLAHGSPSLLWLDVPLDGGGAADFKAIARVKLAALDAAAAGGDDEAGPGGASADAD